MTRMFRWSVFWWFALAVVGGMARGEVFHRIPETDRAILASVAQEYKLTGEQRRLLFAIRLVEAGGPGREMGVLTPAAQRYKGDHAKSLRLQAQYAAGTIAKRFTGDLAAFAKRYAPLDVKNDPKGLNHNWLSNVRKIMQKG